MQLRPTPAVLRSRSSVKPQAGFTLIEILVAILVLSFGMLGVVGLQAAALQANKEARVQSAAVRLSRDLSDMMRGNFNLARAAGNGYLTASPLTDSNFPASPTSNQQCYAGDCNPQALAIFQLEEWFTRAKRELPGIRVVVCFDSAPYDLSGLPQWTCTNSGDVPVIKVGWSRVSLNKSADGTSIAPVDAATRPAVITPVIPG